jgi:hypothetical protein
MQIVRIEYPATGFGLFRSHYIKGTEVYGHCEALTPKMISDIKKKHDGFPNPFFDKELREIYSYEFCGFKSMQQLNEWFTKYQLKKIIAIGFKIYLIEIDECRASKYQVLYKKENIKNKTDISELFL